jgi:hypothetical protein
MENRAAARSIDRTVNLIDRTVGVPSIGSSDGTIDRSSSQASDGGSYVLQRFLVTWRGLLEQTPEHSFRSDLTGPASFVALQYRAGTNCP